jgi:hypothetical protein
MNVPYITYLNSPSTWYNDQVLNGKANAYIKDFVNQGFVFDVMFRSGFGEGGGVRVRRYSKDLVNNKLVLEDSVEL